MPFVPVLHKEAIILNKYYDQEPVYTLFEWTSCGMCKKLKMHIEEAWVKMKRSPVVQTVEYTTDPDSVASETTSFPKLIKHHKGTKTVFELKNPLTDNLVEFFK
jgi:hypothetical protein